MLLLKVEKEREERQEERRNDRENVRKGIFSQGAISGGISSRIGVRGVRGRPRTKDVSPATRSSWATRRSEK